MSKISDTWKIFISYMLVIFLVLCCGGAFGQAKFCKEKICVVEFNAEWNKDNSVPWLDGLVNCGVTRILITDAKMLEEVKMKYNITIMPTVIVYNGKEIKRFQGCLKFKIKAKRKDVQEIINKAL